jgi:3-oxoacyl-[acyl-carrier-protein] synthase I
MKMTYIGAETIISPLGANVAENFNAIRENRSGISLVAKAGFNDTDVYLSKILNGSNTFERVIADVLRQILAQIDPAIIISERTILIISSTKGAIDQNIEDQFGGPVESIARQFGLYHQPIVISNACISGVLAINAARDFIDAGHYDNVLVIGCDIISDFVVYGFQSLFAMSDKPCMPFDAARNGITMGEGCGGVVVSSSESIFHQKPLVLLSGTTANDANHISGPSRTGEGLYRSIRKTMKINDLGADDIQFISAHGTATVFNDEMESIAFERAGLNHIPLNSFKGYFGHTLGAAGVIETAASMQMLREGVLIKSLGYEEAGTTKELNIIKKNTTAEMNTILKTASGFGGGNASLIITKR